MKDVPLRVEINLIRLDVNFLRIMTSNFSHRYIILFSRYAEIIAQLGGKPSETGMARYFGVSQTTTQRWKGGQVPAARDIKTIHDKLGFSYDWLIAGEGEMFDGAQFGRGEAGLARAAGQE